jgi:DNA-directed RNA polymerase subunit RPC12/RpoP
MAEYLCEEDMNTGEYISRDVALRQLNATCLTTGCNNYNGVMCRTCEYADAMDFIDAIPAADVQPVKHGKWEEVAEYGGWGDTYYRCSVCGEEWYIDTGTPIENGMKYCPSCGARMDKEE